MNFRTKPSLMGTTSILAAFALLSVTAAPAQAGLFKKIKKTARKATTTVIREAEDITEMGVDETKALTETAKKSYATTLKTGEDAYRKSVSAVQAGIDAAKEAALRAAADAWVKKYSGFLKKFRSNLDALAQDEKAEAVIDRLTKAASEKRIDDQTRADLLWVGERLGLLDWKPNSIVPGSSGGAMKSSWGLAVTGGGAYVAGAEGSVGLVANCYKEADQRYGAGLALSLGGVLGAAFGGSANVTFYWQPGGVADAEGGSVGLGMEAAAGGVGGTLGVQWSVSEGMKGASAGVPGFYLGWAGGVKVKAGALQGGYTFVPVKSVK
jgi:hypothetical protein